jgi:hypothetical protein
MASSTKSCTPNQNISHVLLNFKPSLELNITVLSNSVADPDPDLFLSDPCPDLWNRNQFRTRIRGCQKEHIIKLYCAEKSPEGKKYMYDNF